MKAEFSLSRLSRRNLVLPLLCAFLFRALIPVGFMPVVAADGTLSLEFCPAYGTAPPQIAAHAHHNHLAGLPNLASGHGSSPVAHHDHGAHDPAGAAQHHAPCVFAASANAAPAHADDLQLVTILQTSHVPQVDFQLAEPIGNVPRAQSPRAPPALI